MEIEGRLVPLTKGRMVFLAIRDDSAFLAFKSSIGTDTTIVLSREAYDALAAMITDADVGTPEREFPFKSEDIKYEWRLDTPASHLKSGT